MPDKAHINSKSGAIVNAKDCTIADLHKKFFCITKDCPATLTLVSASASKEAHFRRLKSSHKHISVDCVRCAMTFDPSKYDESKFDYNNAFDWMFTPPTSSRATTGTATGHLGGGAHNSLKTLGNIYRMCVTKSKADTYNGYLIDDMFADAENYSKYKTALLGNIIVECSYYHKVYGEPALLFNYPADFKSEHIIIRLNFSDEKLCWDYYKKLKDSDHTEPIAIAGNWEATPLNPDCQFQCNFMSSRQIFFVK